MFNDFYYEKPAKFQFLRSMPQDYKDYYKLTVNKNYIPELLAITLSTGLLIAIDGELIVEAEKIGEKLNISSGDGMQVAFRVFDLPIQVPSDWDQAYILLVMDGPI